MITYGNGEVLFDGNAKGFELRYKGVIRITDSPDSLFINANKNKVVGVMLNGQDMPSELFNYEGEFRVLSCKTAQNNVMERERITLQGVDYWNLDSQKWEDDTSLWGSGTGTYLSGTKQRYNKHSIVVNNNIKTQFEGQYTYEDGRSVAANTLIHIHADGVVMTGGVHTEESIEIFAPKADIKRINRIVRQTREATYVAPTTISSGSSGGSSGGGGGY